MKTPPVVHQARARVAAFRRRLADEGLEWSDDDPVDLPTLAEAYLGFVLLDVEGLSDRAALRSLWDAHRLGDPAAEASDAPLAGGLYMARCGAPRWIMMEARDSTARRRFTVAHEIAHWVQEAEPELARSLEQAGGLLDPVQETAVIRFRRCDNPALEGEARPNPRHKVWSEADILEIEANHFAAELLMPLEGVRHRITEAVGSAGIRTRADLEKVVGVVARHYQVSLACSRRHLVRDLGIVPVADHPNADLFAE